MVDLGKDRALIAQLWDGSQASRLPLSLAAAVMFHQTRVDADGDEPLSWIEYARALDIAAAALSRLLTIYTMDGDGEPVPAAIDLSRQRFRGGASELRGEDGSILAPLVIERSDLPPAILRIGRTRIEYLAPRAPRTPGTPATFSTP
jgi:hypothetical protein